MRRTLVVLHYKNLRVMYGKWPNREQERWWVSAVGHDPMEQPEAFRKFVESRYDDVSPCWPARWPSAAVVTEVARRKLRRI
jgi:hypothetical protein